jgi:hypothetical protein
MTSFLMGGVAGRGRVLRTDFSSLVMRWVVLIAPRLLWECQIGCGRVTDSNPVTRLKLVSPCANMG